MLKKIREKLLSIFLMIMIIMWGIINVTEVKADETLGSGKTFGSFGTGNDQFSYISGIAVDNFGSVYVASHSRVQKYDSNGNFITKLTLKGYENTTPPTSLHDAVSRSFPHINGITVDSSGNVYITNMDSYNTCVQKYDSNGNFITQWGSWGSVNGAFEIPKGITVDTSGNVYVADSKNNRIQKFDSNGTYITQWGTIGWAYEIVADALGNVYVKSDGGIEKFDSNGKKVPNWTSEDLRSVGKVAIDTSNNVYFWDFATCYPSRYIKKLDSNGNLITKWANSDNVTNKIEEYMAIDSSENIYVAYTDNSGNSSIEKYSLASNSISSTAISRNTTEPIIQTIVINKGTNSDLTKYLNLNGTNVTWKSSNTSVATVANGIVTAIGTGTATITADGQDGTQYGTFTINVNNNSVTTSDLKTIRLGGQDRYETSAVISQAGWKNGATYAVIADGDNYPDALSAAPLAKKYNAPILLTNTNSIPQSILDEIKRLNVSHIFICGGTAVVSKDVENKLSSMGITVERLGGKDRYETSVLIAEKLGVVSGEIMATNGYEWSDALSASSIAAKKGVPIILTNKDVLPDSTSSFLSRTNFSKTYILGDTDLVSDNVANKFPNEERIVGSNEYERNINIIKRFQNDIDFSNICIASGNNFPDALSGSALATMVSSAIVLVDNSDLQSITTEYANKNLMQVNNVYVFGLQGSVNDDIIKKLFNK